ncbi:MAG: tetratricopeptide repeat protein [Allosphingosinicella sp.]|uniref:tetratricopeptide repeat protein n=1 Tax=Allosphingosinicella sp. TaxID=2823234 RepID=UPI003953DAE5
MKRLAALLLMLAALGSCWELGPERPPETKDRLPPEMMERLVAEPIAAVRAHGIDAGRADFARLLSAEEARSGAASVEAADLHMSFGIGLFLLRTEEELDGRALLLASRDYVHASIDLYRAAFGPGHPEVAVALHSFADIEAEIHGQRLTPAAEAALREAVRIRRATLGARHAETRGAVRRLASLRNSEPDDSAGRAPDEAGTAVADLEAQPE